MHEFQRLGKAVMEVLSILCFHARNLKVTCCILLSNDLVYVKDLKHRVLRCRWILKSDYLTDSSQAGKLLKEEPYEWYKNGLTEDGAINLEAPRKWRLLREKTGHGAFYGMHIIIYGECIAPRLVRQFGSFKICYITTT